MNQAISTVIYINFEAYALDYTLRFELIKYIIYNLKYLYYIYIKYLRMIIIINSVNYVLQHVSFYALHILQYLTNSYVLLIIIQIQI